MNSRALQIALRRERLILRSERLRSELRGQSSAIAQRLSKLDHLASVARRVTSRSGIIALASTLMYFGRRKGSVRFLGRGLMWLGMARRAFSLYRAFVPRR